MLEAVKIILVLYLLTLGIASVFGIHRQLLVVPARAAYSLFAIVVALLTLGRWKLAPPARRVGYRARRKARGIKASIEDWRREDLDEEEIVSGGWISGSQSKAEDNSSGA